MITFPLLPEMMARRSGWPWSTGRGLGIGGVGERLMVDKIPEERAVEVPAGGERPSQAVPADLPGHLGHRATCHQSLEEDRSPLTPISNLQYLGSLQAPVSWP